MNLKIFISMILLVSTIFLCLFETQVDVLAGRIELDDGTTGFSHKDGSYNIHDGTGNVSMYNSDGKHIGDYSTSDGSGIGIIMFILYIFFASISVVPVMFMFFLAIHNHGIKFPKEVIFLLSILLAWACAACFYFYFDEHISIRSILIYGLIISVLLYLTALPHLLTSNKEEC